MENEKIYIFVYGLFRDQARELLGDFEYIGRAYVYGKIWKVNDFYPGFKRGGDTKVWGEIFCIKKGVIPTLDEYEGDEYERKVIETSLGIDCWIYEYKYEINEYEFIQTGDWYLR